jgi:DNA-directed RNA polymerase subunit RPC12/RpoP
MQDRQVGTTLIYDTSHVTCPTCSSVILIVIKVAAKYLII